MRNLVRAVTIPASTLRYMAAAVEPKTPGELLKEYRKKKGWSLRFVAARAGVTHGTVDNFEKNPGGYDRLEAGTIPALARGYGMTEAKFRRILKGEVTSSSHIDPRYLAARPGRHLQRELVRAA